MHWGHKGRSNQGISPSQNGIRWWLPRLDSNQEGVITSTGDGGLSAPSTPRHSQRQAARRVAQTLDRAVDTAGDG
jgi:hypothetical protein